MGVKEGLLALLAEAPKHGYQLKLDLEAATGDGLRINVGQVYSTLQRLERDGLVEVANTDADGRVVYSITPDGQDALSEWVDETETVAAGGRDELSLKVLIAIFTGSIDPLEVIVTQRRSTMSLLQDYTQFRADDADGGDLAWQLHLDRLIYSAEAELRWLDRVEERLSQGPAQTRSDTAAKTKETTEEAVR